MLISAGFKEISERDSWDHGLKPLGKYFVTRNGSSIVAFAIGGQWKPGNGISIVGAHTDSPTLRVKPNSKKASSGYKQVGVETYGGGIWHTWFDRDLSVAGRLFVKKDNKSVPKLVKIDKPILRIPNLAIHLNRGSADKFEFNKESQLFPVLGLVEEQLNKTSESIAEATSNEFQSLGAVSARHHSDFIDLIASTADVKASDIEDFELVLFDTQPSVLGGMKDEFVFSPRLDNLCSSYMATEALIESLEEGSTLESDSTIRLIGLFDHEEVGSTSAQGAASNFLGAILARLASLKVSKQQMEISEAGHKYEYQTYAKSFIISADMAHAIHPNYESKHESNHKPAMNKGPVIKINANQRYATNSPGILLIKKVADGASVPLQLFVVKNDSPCGSTIGPILAARLGIRTLDIGNPQLGMHSVRETCGSVDVSHGVKLFKDFFNKYEKYDSEILVEQE